MSNQAEDYANLSRHSQLVTGKRLIDSLELKTDFHVLALGCGTGELAAYVAQFKVTDGKVTAVDPDKERIAIARQKYKELPNLSIHEGAAKEFLQGRKNEFDMIYSNIVFHWIPVEDHVATLTAIQKALKPGCVTAHVTGEDYSKNLRGMMTHNVLNDDEKKWISENINLLSKQQAFELANMAGFEGISVESFLEESRFESFDAFLSWMCASLGGKIKCNERNNGGNFLFDYGLQPDGSVIDVCYWIKIAMKKPRQ